jgi:hypothetical protein
MQPSSAARRLAFTLIALLLGTIRAQAQTVTLAWDPNSETDVAGYTVYVGVNPGTFAQTFDVGGRTNTTFTFTQAIPGQFYYFSVAAYTSENVVGMRTGELRWKINVGPTLTLPTNQASRVGVSASLQLAANDDGDPLTYTATGLPAGLSINTSTGRISGTPTATGSSTVVATVSDGLLTATRTFTWTIVPPPTADSVAPSSGSGASQLFQLSYSDPLGANAMSAAWVWFNATLAPTSANSCLVYYDRTAARLNLINNTGTTWLQGTLGTSGTLQNSQCAIALAGSSVAVSGNALTLNLAMTFSSTFNGSKNVYIFAASGSASSGWQTRGTWSVPAGAAAVVTADSVSPSTGSGATQTFALRYSDTQGAAGLSTTWAWFHTSMTSTSANSCLVYYNRQTNRLNIINDAGTVWSSAALGGSGTLQNSQCAVSLAGSSAVSSGNTLTLNLAMTFAAGFAGTKNVYMFAANSAINSGWQTRGAWTVPGGGTTPTVSAVSVSPSNGSGTSGTFALQYSDTSGAANLSTAWVWFNTSMTSTSANSCLLYYSRPTNTLSLINNTGTTWSSAPLGGGGTLQNSQCSVALGSSAAVVSGTTLTLNLALTFGPGFAGGKNIYMFAANSALNSGWQTRGLWNVPASATAVTADAVTPNSGAGTTQTFALQYSDTAGVNDLRTVWVWFNETFASTSAYSCMLHYDRTTNLLYLVDPSGSFWDSARLGSGELRNASCVINLAGSSVVQSGNTLTLNLAVTFRWSFFGPKNIYMFASSQNGTNSGWQTRGSWTAQ